jgi:hypothetical protein
LIDAARQAAPFLRADNARDDVEGDQPLFGFFRAINVEGDACTAEKGVGFLCLFTKPGQFLTLEPLMIVAVRWMRAAACAQHLVKGSRGLLHCRSSCQKFGQRTRPFRGCTNYGH